MTAYRYTGDDRRVFPDLTADGHTVEVEPGDIVELDEDPHNSLLVADSDKPTKPRRKSADD